MGFAAANAGAMEMTHRKTRGQAGREKADHLRRIRLFCVDFGVEVVGMRLFVIDLQEAFNRGVSISFLLEAFLPSTQTNLQNTSTYKDLKLKESLEKPGPDLKPIA